MYVFRGNRNKIDLGSSAFRRFIERDLLYVDKSAFIEHVFSNESQVLLFTRPRRMGKSLNLDMLRVFLDPLEDAGGSVPGLFSGLYLESRPVFAELGKHPVISLDFRDFKTHNYKEIFGRTVKKQLLRYVDEDALSADTMADFADPVKYYDRLLADALEVLDEKYPGSPWLLIDEYDKLFMDGAKLGGGEFDEIRTFTRFVLASALKGNPHLGKGILTGVNRIAQESMFSELNNIKVYGVLSESAFDTDFGFSEDEVSDVCTEKELADVRAWYNGYRIGAEKVYFTYSVMNYLSDGHLGNYWGQSGMMDSIKAALTPDRLANISDIIGGFGGACFTTLVKDRLSVDDMDGYRNDDAFYSLLLQSGYLTYDPSEHDGEYQIYLPNLELQSVWRQFIVANIYNSVPSAVMKTFELTGDAEAFSGALAELINGKLSYFDLDSVEPEKTYHVFVLGLLAASGVHVVSNREAGKGRWDVTALFPSRSVIFEFKQTKKDAALRRAAKAAYKQILDKRYADGAPKALPVYGAGVGFCGKVCAVTNARVR
ncbi:MAG: ATP-binding protein [Clostridiales Family XIII bacterium]|nr:ATP-binding protein [Clostridiales Family XIII bacterium]